MSNITNIRTLRVANATTAFGEYLPIGTQVLDENAGDWYFLTADADDTDTITTASTSPMGSGAHGNHTGHVTSVGLATTLTVLAITGQTELTSGLVSTDELLLSDGGVIKRMDISVIETYMEDNLSFNAYTHPDHTGHVTSTGDGATVLVVAAITGQTEGTVIADTDEMLYSDAGVIKRIDMSVLKTYCQYILSSGTGNGEYTGVTTGFASSGTLTAGDIVYISGNNAVANADANGTGTYPAIGIVVDGTNKIIMTKGYYTNTSWSFTANDTIYLSTTAGGITATAPALSGDMVQVVGRAIDPTTVYFTFSDTILELV